jgi:site-specific recombinase XerD
MGQYKTSQRYMLEYILKEYEETDIFLSKLDYSFVVGFEDFLRSNIPKAGQSKIGNNTAMKHIKRLRRMVTLAYHMEWVDRDPFVNFKMKIEKKEREFLTGEELQSIEDLNSSIERLVVVKDLFVFSCYTGISYSDIVELTSDNIVIGIDSNPWIMAERAKTGTPFKIPLLYQAQTLVDKYKDHLRTQSSANLLPKLSNQKLNSYLKEIADLCGIKKNLTFHMARHTFATTVTLSNGVPIETVSKLLGHTKLSTTQIYARVVEKKVSDDMALLRDKIGQREIERAI